MYVSDCPYEASQILHYKINLDNDMISFMYIKRLRLETSKMCLSVLQFHLLLGCLQTSLNKMLV